MKALCSPGGVLWGSGSPLVSVPVCLHSDQCANLNSQSLCRCLGIDHARMTTYHPQGNGQVERFNRTLESMLSKMVNENQKD